MKKILIKLLYITLIFPFYLIAYDLSVCAIFQNEAPYMKEWIEYNKMMGVQHFWLYNNDSTDGYQEVLDPYILDGTVDLIFWPDIWPETPFPFGCQAMAYTDAIARACHKSRWLAIIDLDEFILPLKENSIIKTLDKHFSHEVGIYIKWLNFGTSNVSRVKTDELMTEQLVYAANKGHSHNNNRKSIVKPLYIASCTNPHFCNYSYKNHREDEKVDRYFRINHYWCRDEWHLINVKIPRYLKWHVSDYTVRKLARDFNFEINLDIQRFCPALKLRLIDDKFSNNN